MGAVFSGLGANKAAKTQARAAQSAADTQARGQERARSDLTAGRNFALKVVGQGFNSAVGQLNPLVASGDVDLQAYRSELGLGDAPADYAGFTHTPGYEHRRSEGLRGITNAFAASSGLNSGAIQKAQMRYATGLANQDYDNHLARLGGLAQTGVNARNAMSNLYSGFGKDQANIFLNHATNSANTRIGEGNALAEGAIRVGNAKAQGTQALFDIPQNFLNENLQVAGTGAEIFGNVAGGASSFAAISDERDKTDVVPVGVGLDFVMDLEPITFTYDVRQGENPMDGPVSGFMAQSLQEIQQDHGVDLGLVNDSDGQHLTVNYASLIPVLVGAVQELTHKVKELEAA